MHFPGAGTKANPRINKYQMTKKWGDLSKKREGVEKKVILKRITFIWSYEREVDSYES